MRFAARSLLLAAWLAGALGLAGCEKRGVTPPTPSTSTGAGEAPVATPPASAPSTP
jgi:hypothetical protein